MPILEELHALCDEVCEQFRTSDRADPPVRYIVLSSMMSGIFNMGGDLGRIAALSRAADRSGLDHYGHLTADIVHRMWTGLGWPIVTISAVDGNAFGGGFEAALSTRLLVAGPHARFAFPEMRFGLFPGMGATSLIARRASGGLAERLILDGTTLDGPQALALGICDRVLHHGSALTFVRRVLRRGGRKLYDRLISQISARQAVWSYPHEEARSVVAVWVDAVLDLEEARRRHIDRIVGAQRLKVLRLQSGVAP